MKNSGPRLLFFFPGCVRNSMFLVYLNGLPPVQNLGCCIYIWTTRHPFTGGYSSGFNGRCCDHFLTLQFGDWITLNEKPPILPSIPFLFLRVAVILHGCLESKSRAFHFFVPLLTWSVRGPAFFDLFSSSLIYIRPGGFDHLSA